VPRWQILGHDALITGQIPALNTTSDILLMKHFTRKRPIVSPDTVAALALGLFFTIFQTFLSSPDGTPYFGESPADFFDFIIIDECHRAARTTRAPGAVSSTTSPRRCTWA
jgi:hypothetical protein